MFDYETMEVDDFNQLTEFVFDQSTPESDDEARIEETPDAPPSHDPAPRAGRIIRRRARKACVACHKRKVRCDVLSRGHTCTNCRLDGITCVIRSGGKRMRGEPPGAVEEVPASSPAENRASQLEPPADAPATIAHFTVESVETNFPSAASAGLYSTTSAQPFPPFNGSGQLSSQTDMMFAYFDFLEAETLSHIAPEDFKFLEYKGCFHLPSRPILNDLVREYFLHVHPVLPVIDERAFWELYFPSGRRTTHRRIPLFVFRAMLFVSCSFASDDTIRRLGFRTAVEARSCMYRRAKLLYDFDTTSDPISLSQGALILTYYSSDREPLANTSWLRLAIQYANSANVPMYEQDPAIPDEERLIRKRLWWCIILRDRILPLGVRRSIQITHDNFDFSQPKLSEKDLEPEFRNSRVYDRQTKIDLARIFLAQLDLAVELTDAISYVYPVNGFRSFDQLDYNAMLSMPSKIERCKDKLDTWHTIFRKTVEPEFGSKKHKSVFLYSGLTSIYYQSARAALCQCESFMLQADDSAMHELRMKELGSALHSSVASISETVRDFVKLDIAKYVPVSVVAYLALPIVLNSLDLQNLSPTNARTEGKRRQLRLLNETMDLCNDRYTGTVAANNLIKKTIEAARSENDHTRDQTIRSTTLVRSNPEVRDWFEVFVNKPSQYLRISFSIDMSLSTGRYPETNDLPKRISMHSRLVPSHSIPQSLMPVAEERPVIDTLLKPARLERTTDSHLDYFDFDEPETWVRSENSPWNGQIVDKILDEVWGGGGRLWTGPNAYGESAHEA